MFGLVPLWSTYIMFPKAFTYVSFMHTFQFDISPGLELLGHRVHMFNYNRYELVPKQT